MNGAFEKSGIYPYNVEPAAGYGNPNPTGEYVITTIELRGMALHVEDFGYTFVPFEKGTRFENAVEATRHIANIINR